MFSKILVALDCSALGQNLFQEGLALAEATKARLMLLHVLSFQDRESGDLLTPSLTLGNWGYYLGLDTSIIEQSHQQWQQYKEQDLSFLRSLVEKAVNRGVEADYSQHIGNPGITICEVASSWGADLILIGRRGSSGLSELILGSVSNYVLHRAPCSVLVVYRQAKPESNDYNQKQTEMHY